LQPWRYLSEVARGLAAQEHAVTIISDQSPEFHGNDRLAGISIIHLPSVRNTFWRQNKRLQEALFHTAPDVILWHVGLISFLHQRIDGPPNTPILGVFTSPIYQIKDLTRLGIGKIAKGYNLSTLHALGSLFPRWLFRFFMANSNLSCLVVQTETTHHQLVNQNIWLGDIVIIPPGIDEIWWKPSNHTKKDLRNTLGYKPDDTVIVYFGSPAPLRGLPALVEAFTIAHSSDSALKLLILSRHRAGELQQENTALRRLVSESQFHHHVQIIDGYLDPETLVHHVAASDIVALPFELVPSDAPLSLLEAGALGKPLVTTRVACLPELVSKADHYLADPADPNSLSQALLQAVKKLHRQSNHRDQLISRTWRDMSVEWSNCIQAFQNGR
jgi:glycosyltransferase involved in cell wall biosynthesis